MTLLSRHKGKPNKARGGPRVTLGRRRRGSREEHKKERQEERRKKQRRQDCQWRRDDAADVALRRSRRTIRRWARVVRAASLAQPLNLHVL